MSNAVHFESYREALVFLATAGVVVRLARKYRVALPVLTAVAQVLDGALSPAEAVAAVMALPQIEER